MTQLPLSDGVLAELKLAGGAVTIEARPLLRWEFWVPAAAAASAVLIVGAMLLTLTAELRAGWVPGHELPMDKAAAIHKLLFRP